MDCFFAHISQPFLLYFFSIYLLCKIGCFSDKNLLLKNPGKNALKNSDGVFSVDKYQFTFWAKTVDLEMATVLSEQRCEQRRFSRWLV